MTPISTKEAADQGDDLFVLHQLGCYLGRDFRVPLIVLDQIFHWSPIDAAISVDAVEIGLCRLRCRRKIVKTCLADDRTDLYRLPACHLTIVQSAARCSDSCSDIGKEQGRDCGRTIKKMRTLYVVSLPCVPDDSSVWQNGRSKPPSLLLRRQDPFQE